MGRLVTRQRVHMIGNAHIDPVWLWQWPEGYQEVRATFRAALDRMEEYPDFVFTCDSVLFFAWVEESDPELFAELRAHGAVRLPDPSSLEPVQGLLDQVRAAVSPKPKPSLIPAAMPIPASSAEA